MYLNGDLHEDYEEYDDEDYEEDYEQDYVPNKYYGFVAKDFEDNHEMFDQEEEVKRERESLDKFSYQFVKEERDQPKVVSKPAKAAKPISFAEQQLEWQK